VVGGVEDEVLAHDGKADETEVSTAKGGKSAVVLAWLSCIGGLCHPRPNFAVTFIPWLATARELTMRK
jgi:hypothetical protein